MLDASWCLARRTLGLRSSSPKVQVGGLLTMPPEDTGADRSAMPDLDYTQGCRVQRHHTALTPPEARCCGSEASAWCEMIVDCCLQIQEIV